MATLKINAKTLNITRELLSRWLKFGPTRHVDFGCMFCQLVWQGETEDLTVGGDCHVLDTIDRVGHG